MINALLQLLAIATLLQLLAITTLLQQLAITNYYIFYCKKLPINTLVGLLCRK